MIDWLLMLLLLLLLLSILAWNHQQMEQCLHRIV
jgi:hypothetical protein